MSDKKGKSFRDWAKEVAWPADPATRAKLKTKYKNVGLFVVVSVILYRYGKQLGDLIYDQDQLEDQVRMAMR